MMSGKVNPMRKIVEQSQFDSDLTNGGATVQKSNHIERNSSCFPSTAASYSPAKVTSSLHSSSVTADDTMVIYETTTDASA
jgi:hypothetical protein